MSNCFANARFSIGGQRRVVFIPFGITCIIDAATLPPTICLFSWEVSAIHASALRYSFLPTARSKIVFERSLPPAIGNDPCGCNTMSDLDWRATIEQTAD